MKPHTVKLSVENAILLSLSCALPGLALAAVTDLSNAPLSNGADGSVVVKPNIAFVVDDSGSMAENNMPDSGNSSNNCYGWYKYNTIAYNPAYTYKPPFKLDGTTYSDGVKRFPDSVFTAALKDGYFGAAETTYDNSDNGAVDLSDRAPLRNSDRTRYYYSTHKTSTTASDCQGDNNYNLVTSSASIAAPGVTAGSPAALTNYANWYTYYRDRAGVMKAAAGEAFSALDEGKYRIGLFYLNSVDSQSGGKTANTDLKIADFAGSTSGTQRYDWYQKLYGARTSNVANTPLRAALARMGQMYAGKFSGWDPVQYSCQQNFTILSTDGQWNTANENSNYGPLDLSNNLVGNQDVGAVIAVAPKATIRTDGAFGTNNDKVCYRATSLRVNPSSGSAVELLSPTILDFTCPNNANAAGREDIFGQALTDSINANSGVTGFTAEISKSSGTSQANRITITGPTGATYNNATLSLSWTRTGGSTNEPDPTISAFGGGVDSAAGASLPYKDINNASNTLADVAYYYYLTDLRTSALNNCSNTIGGTTYNNLCVDNVLGSGKDTNNKQHMTTFTLGLGVNGTITYESNYETANDITGVTQYYDILNGSASWPNPSNDDAKIDDLWHAAVNGRGTYYNASNADTLRKGLQAALAGVKARTGSSAAAATSNLEPVAGDNYVYVALYRTQYWDGDLKAFEINPDTGALTGSQLWSAQEKLDEQVASAASGDGRTIKYFSSGGTNKLKDFDLTNLTNDSLNGYFADICTDAGKSATQCTTLSTAQKAVADSAGNLINFLRGSRTYEDESSNATADNKVFRDRAHVLGDIVNAVPVYMKTPPFSYDRYDTTYGTFKANKASRAPTVYIAANDGMLHAINATSDSNAADYASRGKERWAYVPRAVMKNMWKLADTNYANNHAYFVDGSPTVADICVNLASSDNQMCNSAADWRTIIIGGLNKGGCSYYALDVTDPANPKGLWEFSHEKLGLTFGNPVVGKDKTGKWVVVFASGYNNYPSNECGSAGGDGNGHVFVLDAATGALLSGSDNPIPTMVDVSGTATAVGTTSTPSGLAKLNAWINNPDLPIIDRLYGGDLLGNLWRIDFDNNYNPSGKEAVRLAQFKIGSTPQPITIKPELAEVRYGGVSYPVVMVGTGKYLGSSDLTDTSQQTIYSVKDRLATTGISDARGANMIQRSMTQTSGISGSLAGRTIRTISGSNVDWSTNDGWYLDLNPGGQSPGERVNVDMSLQFNILTVAANVPETNACTVGGSAYLYFLDINTGKALSTALDGMGGVRLGSNALVAGIKTLRLTSGKTVTVVTDTAGGVESEGNPSPTGSGAGAARRTTWREIPD